jgi:hypothetical protein
VLTNSDLWDMVGGPEGSRLTESVWLQVLKRGILRRKYASIAWDRVLSLERVIERVLNGEITDVDEETVNEARRIGLLISSLSLRKRHALGQYGLAFVELGTGVRRNQREARKAAGKKGE